MFLSRIELSDSPATYKALASPQKFHAALESCFDFDDSKTRKLWRIDKLNGKLYLLVVSVTNPNFAPFVQQFGIAAETKDYNDYLDKIETGQTFRFRFTGNPVYSAKENKKTSEVYSERGKVFPHATVNQKMVWLLKKSVSSGFEIIDGSFEVIDGRLSNIQGQFDITETGWKVFHKKSNEKPVKINYAVFEGMLNVTDANAFRQVLVNGLGKAKAYGCGLMTVVKI